MELMRREISRTGLKPCEEQCLIDHVPRKSEEALGGMKRFLKVEKELTLDSDPMVFSILSSEAAGQASVQTGILHLQKTFFIN